MENSTQFDLVLPSYERTEFSPKFDRDFAGLLIDAPKEVSFDANKTVPIFGGFRLSNKVSNVLGDNLIEGTVLVFVNKKTGDAFSFNLVPDKDLLDDGIETIGEGSVDLAVDDFVKIEKTMVLRYFNIDATMFVESFPDVSATYIVYATFLQLKSNVIEIKVSKQ